MVKQKKRTFWQKVYDKDYTLCLPFLSSILLGSVFLSRHLFWLSLVAFIPLIIFLQRAHKYTTNQIIYSVTLAGYVFFLGVFAWELQTTPNSWTALQGNLALFSKILVWLLSSLFATIGFWVLAKIIARFKTKPTQLLIGLPVTWALCELVRVFCFAVFTYGPGGSFSPNWNLGVAGLGIMPTPLAYSSRFVGLYGMSALLIVINIALYLAMCRRKFKTATLILVPVFVLSGVGYWLYQPTGSTIKVASVHLESQDSLDSWDKIPLPSKDLDLLVVPEYSLFFNNKDYAEFAYKNFGHQTTLITSAVGDSEPATNLLRFYSVDRGIYNQQAKTFLISGGEYMPYVMHAFFVAINQSYLVQLFNDAQQVQRGPEPEKPVQTHAAKVGALVCSGILSLNEYRRLSVEGAEILTNSASLSLIDQASLYHVQESYLTRFHSIANARAFVHSSRSGESYIMDTNGQHVTDHKGNSTIITADAPTNTKRTLYTFVGEWFLLISAGITVGTIRYRKSVAKALR